MNIAFLKKTSKRFLLVCFVNCATIIALYGQLIKNGNMEVGTCSTKNVPADWIIVSGTPDYCDSSPVTCPELSYKMPTESPQGGRWVRFFHAMTVSGKHNEVFGQSLVSSLEIGNRYKVSFYAGYSKGNIEWDSRPTFMVVGFSFGPPNEVGKYHRDTLWLKNEEEWVHHSYSFVASDSFNFISFGKEYITERFIAAACYVDDVRIEPCEMPFVNLGSDTVLCQGTTIELNASVPDGSYLWQDSSRNETIMVSTEGIYRVEVSNGCGSFVDSVKVDFAPLPDINLGVDTVLCEGEELILDVYTPMATYKWQDNSTIQSYLVKTAGEYWVQVSDSCGISYDSISIRYNPLPSLNLGNDTIICRGTMLTFDFTSVNAHYIWNDKFTNTIYNIENEGIYWVTKTEGNCTSTDTINVGLMDCKAILIMPNVFTPNQDDYNDYFIPKEMYGIKEATLNIYDKWGKKIYESSDLLSGWDGISSNGSRFVVGNYYWIINYSDYLDNHFYAKGFLTLLR